MGGGDGVYNSVPMTERKEASVHPDVSDLFFNSDHSDIVPSKKGKVETDHLGYSVEGLKAKATGFIESLKRMGAQTVPTVEGLIKDFHDRH